MKLPTNIHKNKIVLNFDDDYLSLWDTKRDKTDFYLKLTKEQLEKIDREYIKHLKRVK